MCLVKFFSPGTPSPPSTNTDKPDPSNISAGKRTSPKQEKKQKQKTNDGEMPEWMINFVTTNNLVVGKDVKLDESKANRKRRSSTSTSGTGTTTKTGTKTGTGTGSKAGSSSPRVASKSRASPAVAKKADNSPAGSRSPSIGRPVTPAKGAGRRSAAQ